MGARRKVRHGPHRGKRRDGEPGRSAIAFSPTRGHLGRRIVADILITGATGFVGSHLVEALGRRGLAARALVRASSDTSRLERYGLARQVGDLTDATSLERAVDGAGTVIHLAALAHGSNDEYSEGDYVDTNVRATQRLLEACKESRVKRFVFLSSVKVLGDGHPSDKRFTYSENSIPAPCDAYGRSKLEAERLVQSACDEANIESIILRPPLVYGPGVRANFLKLLSVIHRRIPLPLSAIDNRRSLIYVRNLCDALVRCIEAPGKSGGVFMIADNDVSTPDLVREIGKHMPGKTVMLPVPVFLLKCLATLSGNMPACSRLTGSLVVDSGRFREGYHWTPRYSFPEGIHDTVKWFLNTPH